MLIFTLSLATLAQKVKWNIKNILKTILKSIWKLPQETILCTIDVVGLYPDIPHTEGLTSLQRFLEIRDKKQISIDKMLLKNYIFEFNEKTFKQVHETVIGTKFAPPYAILFMADSEEKIINAFEKKPMIWWRYIDDISFICKHGEESLEKFFNKLNSFHPIIKFTARVLKRNNFLKFGSGGTHDRFAW